MAILFWILVVHLLLFEACCSILRLRQALAIMYEWMDLPLPLAPRVLNGHTSSGTETAARTC